MDMRASSWSRRYEEAMVRMVTPRPFCAQKRHARICMEGVHVWVRMHACQ
jgi:hypothetical protein